MPVGWTATAERMEDPAPNVLEYFPERRGPDSSAVAMYVLLAPVVTAIFFSAVELSALALPAAAAVALLMWMYHRRRRTRPEAVLCVESARLRVTQGKSRELLNVSLDDLLEVSLDTKTIQRVQENAGSAIPDLRFVNSVVGPEVDTSRIELETPHGSIFLTDEYLSSTYATEWFGRIRKFLRQNGWVPEDERELVPDGDVRAAYRRTAPRKRKSRRASRKATRQTPET